MRIRKKKFSPEFIAEFFRNLRNKSEIREIEIFLIENKKHWKCILDILINSILPEAENLEILKLQCTCEPNIIGKLPNDLRIKFFESFGNCKNLKALVFNMNLFIQDFNCKSDKGGVHNFVNSVKSSLLKISISETVLNSNYKELRYLLEECKNLSNLEIFSLTTNKNEELCKGILKCKNLQKVHLSFRNSNNLAKDLFESLCSKNIIHLSLENINVTEDDQKIFLKCLNENPIKNLSIAKSSLRFDTVKFIHEFHEFIANKIENLSIKDCIFCALIQPFPLITKSPNKLKSIQLLNCCVDFNKIFEIIGESKNLFNIDINFLYDTSNYKLKPIHPVFNFESLKIALPLIPDNGLLEKLFLFFENLSLHCQNIPISVQNLSDSFLQIMQFSLFVIHKISWFKELNININDTDNNDGYFIKQLIKMLPTKRIEILIINTNRNKDIEELLDILPTINGLKKLVIGGCTINPDEAKNLLTIIEKCKELCVVKCNLKMPNEEFPTYLAYKNCIIQFS